MRRPEADISIQDAALRRVLVSVLNDTKAIDKLRCDVVRWMGPPILPALCLQVYACLANGGMLLQAKTRLTPTCAASTKLTRASGCTACNYATTHANTLAGYCALHAV